MSERVHLLISYGRHNRLIRIGVPVWLARAALSVIVAIPLAIGYLAIDHSRRTADQQQLASLKYENAVLRGKMDMFAAGVDSLKSELQTLAEHDAQVRLLANLPLVPPDIRKMGIGGGMVGSNEPGAQLQNSIDWMLDQARFQRTSYTSIANDLAKQSQLQSNTPSILPTAGWITSTFGSRSDPFTGRSTFHEGLDIVGMPGQPIRATADGVVVTAGWYQNWGQVVEIDHGRGIHSFYAHNSSINVRQGEKVKRGQQIASLGSTGRSTGNHCHYGIKVNGAWTDPAKYVLSDLAKAD
jgi:murein DD-endopeptidase MepM/ murein hydrolase activator NlpD